MKRKMNLLLVALLAVAFAMMSCDTGTGPDPTPESGTITVSITGATGYDATTITFAAFSQGETSLLPENMLGIWTVYENFFGQTPELPVSGDSAAKALSVPDTAANQYAATDVDKVFTAGSYDIYVYIDETPLNQTDALTRTGMKTITVDGNQTVVFAHDTDTAAP